LASESKSPSRHLAALIGFEKETQNGPIHDARGRPREVESEEKMSFRETRYMNYPNKNQEYFKGGRNLTG